MGSPEERLLRLIRGEVAPATAGGSPAPQPSAAASSARAVRTLHAWRWSWPSWGWTAVHAGLGGFVVLELAAVLALLVLPQPSLRAPAPASVDTTSAPPSQEPPVQLAAPRPLFQAGGDTAAWSSPAATPSAVGARFRLIGVVAGNPPQAIIEDAQTGQTHFAAPGEPLIEGWSVESLQQDRVYLERAGERLELAL